MQQTLLKSTFSGFALALAVLIHASPAAAQSVLALAPGDDAPQVVGWGLDGKLEFVEWKGATLLNFWATWCAPCRVEMPALQEIQAKYPDRIRVLGINREQGTAEDLQLFLDDLDIEYTVLRAHLRFDHYKALVVLPTTLLIDAEGTIIRKYVGAQLEQVEGLKKDIDNFLAGRELAPLVIPMSEEGKETPY